MVRVADRAVIFDMDDTLVASGRVWLRAETRLFRALGSQYSAEIAATYKGQNARDVGATIRRALAVRDPAEEDCAAMMRRFLMEEFGQAVTPLPGADALVRGLAGRFSLAVASGSPQEAIGAVLDRMGWSGIFAATVSSEKVEAGKPAPDVFLAAARALGVEPCRCLVIEDSLHGVCAARAAGMRCWVVPSLPDPRVTARADRSFGSLAEVTASEVEKVFA